MGTSNGDSSSTSEMKEVKRAHEDWTCKCGRKHREGSKSKQEDYIEAEVEHMSHKKPVKESKDVGVHPFHHLLFGFGSKEVGDLDCKATRHLVSLARLVAFTEPHEETNIQCYRIRYRRRGLLQIVSPPAWLPDRRHERDRSYSELAAMQSAISARHSPPTKQEEADMEQLRVRMGDLAAGKNEQQSISTVSYPIPMSFAEPSITTANDVSRTRSKAPSSNATITQTRIAPRIESDVEPETPVRGKRKRAQSRRSRWLSRIPGWKLISSYIDN